jgi:malate dehydrogenase (quinone)
VKKGAIKDPRSFIHPVPHCSFVKGEENITFLKKRIEALSSHHSYRDMEYSDDKEQMAEWFPLVMEGRGRSEKAAATRNPIGTYVDYGALTNDLLDSLRDKEGFSTHFSHRVQDIHRNGGEWHLQVRDEKSGENSTIQAKFLFIGAGGGSLPLLQKSKIPEGRGYAGFPVSGIWLRCDNTEVRLRHDAKVYGKAAVGSPPMSVPHLDNTARISICSKRSILKTYCRCWLWAETTLLLRNTW